MMQGFYLLAMQRARRRAAIAALSCLCAAASLILAVQVRTEPAAIPAGGSVSYTVRSEKNRLIVRQSDGSVLRTAIDTRSLPAADQNMLREGIVLNKIGRAHV